MLEKERFPNLQPIKIELPELPRGGRKTPSQVPLAAIKSIVEREPNWKLYLDALPGLVDRKVVCIEMAGGEIVSEAFGPEGEVSNELSANRKQPSGKIPKSDRVPFRETRKVEPIDLWRFHRYYR